MTVCVPTPKQAPQQGQYPNFVPESDNSLQHDTGPQDTYTHLQLCQHLGMLRHESDGNQHNRKSHARSSLDFGDCARL
jgi:hypothetical protein